MLRPHAADPVKIKFRSMFEGSVLKIKFRNEILNQPKVQNLENPGEVEDSGTDSSYDSLQSPDSNQNSDSEESYCKKNCPKFIFIKYDQRIRISNKYARTKIEARAINIRNVSKNTVRFTSHTTRCEKSERAVYDC